MASLDITKLPIVKLSPEQERSFAGKVRVEVIAEGRATRRAGLPKDYITSRIRDPDLALDWQNGWRWEDEEIKARTRA